MRTLINSMPRCGSLLNRPSAATPAAGPSSTAPASPRSLSDDILGVIWRLSCETSALERSSGKRQQQSLQAASVVPQGRALVHHGRANFCARRSAALRDFMASRSLSLSSACCFSALRFLASVSRAMFSTSCSSAPARVSASSRSRANKLRSSVNVSRRSLTFSSSFCASSASLSASSFSASAVLAALDASRRGATKKFKQPRKPALQHPSPRVYVGGMHDCH
mmetsp:Transcript_7910/g.19613  ORF Transcript_7910/g.19613 Transcript_7910/m.19613 type:complete len:223 (-) Transcript_7910:66-734(-)